MYQGVSETASLDEIKQAFADETRKSHPDSKGSISNTNSTEKLMQLKEAYDVLKKPEKRKEYDRELEFSKKASREMFYENLDDDDNTINLNIRGPQGYKGASGPRRASRVGHFFDPSKELEIEKHNDRIWWVLGGAVIALVVGNIVFYHPDLTGSNETATKKFVEVKEAYDVLKDDEKRKTYDAMLNGGYGHGAGFQNPFPGGGFPEGNFKQWRSNGWEYTFKNDGRKFTNEDFQRIWQEFQRKTQHPPHAQYDQMFREQRQKAWDDFSIKREEMWRKRAEEYARKYPFDNPDSNPIYKLPWDKINKYMAIYIGVFFLIALFQTIYSSGERQYQKSVNPSRAQPQQMTPNESLQQMIYKMPTNPESERPAKDQIREERPFGFPDTPRPY
ncbi:hypothetical protein FO519_007383 [Halicephalobus sp. NKZ332]|nr:hypothetical protein FO519_007383 [Halicephalobus sp. NKZ332]